MKVEILRSVMISGEPALAGSLVEVSNSDAQLLIGIGKAKLATQGKVEVKPEPEVTETPKRGRKAASTTTSTEEG